jgi:hypothetical protein
MWLKHKSLYWEVIIPFFTCFHELSFRTMGFFWWSENVLLMQHFRKTLLLDSTKIGSDTVCSSAWENRSDQSIPCFRKWLRILTKVQVVEHLEHLQWWLHEDYQHLEPHTNPSIGKFRLSAWTHCPGPWNHSHAWNDEWERLHVKAFLWCLFALSLTLVKPEISLSNIAAISVLTYIISQIDDYILSWLISATPYLVSLRD